MFRTYLLFPKSVFPILLLLVFSQYLSGCQSSPHEEAEETDIFMWMGSNHLIEKDPMMFRSMLAFAERHQIIPYESGANSTEDLERFLKYCKEAGITKTWIEIGPKKEGVTIKEFVEEPEKREATLERFRRLARSYRNRYPEFARITIFDEAPLGAFATDPEVKNDYDAQFRQFKEYAPKAFSLLYTALKEEFSKAEIGIFMHHPHNASPEMAGSYSYIAEFMQKTDSLNTVPDFIYSDVYRGYFNRGYGIEATDRYITDVVAHTKNIARKYGAKAYHLGQAHTIKLGYTPSRRQIDTNVDAMLKGNPDGIGWYWPNYAATNVVRERGSRYGRPSDIDVSFNPFIPNNWGEIGPAGSLYGTSRDRFSYSYLRMLEATGKLKAEERFDLWIYGYDFDHVEHSIYLQTKNEAGKSWTLIGNINPQQDKDGYAEEAGNEYIYSYADRWHAVVFHGLSRSHFIDNDSTEAGSEMKFRIDSKDGSDGSKLAAVYAMPYHETRHYATEQEVTGFIDTQPRWVQINSLVSYIRPVAFELTPDTSLTVTLQGDQNPLSADKFREWLDSKNTAKN